MAVVLSEGPKIPWRPLIGQRRLPSADRNQPGSGWAAPARHPPGGQPSPAEGRRGWRVTSRDTGRSDWWHQSTGACPWVVIGSSLGRHWVVIGSDSISQAPGRNEPILARVMAPLVIQLTSPPHRAIGASSGTSPPPPPKKMPDAIVKWYKFCYYRFIKQPVCMTVEPDPLVKYTWSLDLSMP